MLKRLLASGATGKLVASVAVLGAAASIAGLGPYAAFTSSTSASQTLASGTVAIALPAAGVSNRLTVGASGLVPATRASAPSTSQHGLGEPGLT